MVVTSLVKSTDQRLQPDTPEQIGCMRLLVINFQACDYITIVILLPQAMACIQLSLLKVKCNRCKTFIGNEEDVGMGVV